MLHKDIATVAQRDVSITMEEDDVHSEHSADDDVNDYDHHVKFIYRTFFKAAIIRYPTETKQHCRLNAFLVHCLTLISLHLG